MFQPLAFCNGTLEHKKYKLQAKDGKESRIGHVFTETHPACRPFSILESILAALTLTMLATLSMVTLGFFTWHRIWARWCSNRPYDTSRFLFIFFISWQYCVSDDVNGFSVMVYSARRNDF